jgi:hypothetical protein
MRLFASILLIFLLAFQAEGGAVTCSPCAVAAMEMPSCHTKAAPVADGAGVAAKCCCAMRQDRETSGEYEAIERVALPRTGPVYVAVPTTAKDLNFNLAVRADSHPPLKRPGSPPALYLLNNSYLI